MPNDRYTLTPPEIADRLRYDPIEGTLFWKASGRYYKAGDEAGTVARDGNVWVSLSGHKYAARDLVWCLATGDWPDRPLRLKSDLLDLSPTERRRRRQDLTLSNIEPYTPTLSTSPRAVHVRRLRAMHKAAKAGVPLNAVAEGYYDPTRPNIHWSAPSGQWVVKDNSAALLRLPAAMRPVYDRELARFPTLDEARAFNDAQNRRVNYLVTHPVPDLANDIRLRVAAGDKYFGITLWEAHHTFAYDPDTGDLIWRAPASYVGLSAGKKGTTVDALYVSLHGRRYPVHNLCWFLTHAVWPGRKGLGWRNGDQTDNRLSNLYLTTEEPTA